jgi:hypothetical protein
VKQGGACAWGGRGAGGEMRASKVLVTSSRECLVQAAAHIFWLHSSVAPAGPQTAPFLERASTPPEPFPTPVSTQLHPTRQRESLLLRPRKKKQYHAQLHSLALACQWVTTPVVRLSPRSRQVWMKRGRPKPDDEQQWSKSSKVPRQTTHQRKIPKSWEFRRRKPPCGS